MQRHPARSAIRGGQQVNDQGMLDHLDTGVLLDPAQSLDQRPRDLRTRGVSPSMRDAIAVMPTLPGQLDLAVVSPIEFRSERDQFTNSIWPLGHQGPHRVDIAQAHPGNQRVLQMVFR